MKTIVTIACLTGILACSSRAAEPRAGPLPVRGLHVSAPSRKDIPAFAEFIRGPLAKAGVNTLIVEFNLRFDFKSRPEFADPSAPNKDDVKRIVDACREAKIQLIPQVNCLGHQSWAKHTGRLLEKHPEFDETPGKYPENKGIYCRSYCPLHPEVHKVLFALIDELAQACEAKAFHVGMDEVFILADKDCPRCKGKTTAEVFAGEVKCLHDHLASIGCRMWMWGDRFIDGKKTGIGTWEASTNATHSAVDVVPKDIVICDWHYQKAPETAGFFAGKGFDVVSCPWRKPAVGEAQVKIIRSIRAGKDRPAAAHALGVVQTTWCGVVPFMQAYNKPAGADKTPAGEAAQCFRATMQAAGQPAKGE
ncbi:MAG: Glycosyl hydrolase family 20, catalytic domain [Planctomycetes bacterium ADurb.Bin126]|nr:MAG: Glycosyl hydrolase family 20, catalytic domain [Planctomycetes bacterium ADurb.Bin126]HQL72144.1 family 20 glycosylhydrolase [Phycisphaerae bacterium]